MPYLDAETKANLEKPLTELQVAIYNLITWVSTTTSHDAMAQAGGILNYIFNMLALGVLMNIPEVTRYAHLERLMGTFESAKLEFWRRVVVPYEEEARRRSGDVFTDES